MNLIMTSLRRIPSFTGHKTVEKQRGQTIGLDLAFIRNLGQRDFLQGRSD